MKKYFLLLAVLVTMQVFLPTLKTNQANACDRKCSYKIEKKKAATEKPTTPVADFEEEGSTGIRPFPFSMI